MPQTLLSDLRGARDALLALPHPFTVDAVHSVVRGLRLTPADLVGYMNFSPDGYTRTEFYRGPRFEILVLCWKDGQASPIHDHARSICTMAVVQGTCRTDMYALEGGRTSESIAAGQHAKLRREGSSTLEAGQVATVVGGDIHRVGNFRGDGSDLVTVHFYLPPIEAMRCYDEDTGRCWISRPGTLPPPA